MNREEHITEQILEWMGSNDDLRSFVSRVIDAAVADEQKAERDACIGWIEMKSRRAIYSPWDVVKEFKNGDHRKPKKPRYGVEPQFHVVDAIHEGIVKTFGTIEAAQAECNRLNGGK